MLTLVILAAGKGSRYGGLKQLEPVGPGGAALLEYALYDALRLGFDRALVVIRRETEPLFAERLRPWLDRGTVRFAYQNEQDLPSGLVPPQPRRKPWGTGHAVLAVSGAVPGPLAVMNADDFYGAGAIEAIATFLGSLTPSDPPTWAMVGFPLRATLDSAGPVSRAVCEIGSHGWLGRIVEVPRVHVEDGHGVAEYDDGRRERLGGDTPVSMNLWGFGREVFTILEERFRRFVRDEDDGKREFRLPDVVADAIASGRARVKVLESETSWFGITHRDDVSRVRERLEALTALGVYPEELPA